MRYALPLALAVVLSMGSGVASAAVYQWSVPDGNARAYLWVPPECAYVRGVVVASHNMLEQRILEHPVMRETLAELGFAEVWAVPSLEATFDFNAGAGAHFDRVVDALAEASGYDELRFAPIVPMGHSAHATYPWNVAAWAPERTLAVLSVKGDAPQTHLTGNGKPNAAWGERNIDGVPGLMVMGEYEWWLERLKPALDFQRRFPGAPVAVFGDAGHGHFDASDELVSYLAMFIRKSAERRLPKDGPNGEPVTLTPVDPDEGWRMDVYRRDEPPATPAAPNREYAGPRDESFWCFDEEMARLTEAHYARARGKRPQLLGIVQNGAVLPQTNTHAQVRPAFLPLDDGVTFELSATFLDSVPPGHPNLELWAKLPMGSPLGHANGGGPVRLSRITGPFEQVSPTTFRIRLDRTSFTPDRRNHEAWLLATHPGDDDYKSAVQQALVVLEPNRAGEPQSITFPPIPDQRADASAVKLAATSDAGLPVSYYVVDGPAEVDGDTLRLTPVPPRAKFPLKVTVVAWQWGRRAGPAVQTAAPVTRELWVHRAAPNAAGG